jgi:hypothetical protein
VKLAASLRFLRGLRVLHAFERRQGAGVLEPQAARVLEFGMSFGRDGTVLCDEQPTPMETRNCNVLGARPSEQLEGFLSLAPIWLAIEHL